MTGRDFVQRRQSGAGGLAYLGSRVHPAVQTLKRTPHTGRRSRRVSRADDAALDADKVAAEDVSERGTTRDW